MIVSPAPRLAQIVRDLWKPLSLLFIWDVAVTVAYIMIEPPAPSLPLTLFGTVLGLVLGFRCNSAYQRWWEARGLWGLMINASRNIARATRNFMPDPDAREIKRIIVKRQIAYAHALRCQLRRQTIDAAALGYLADGADDLALNRVNVANGLLDGTGRCIDDARRMGWLDTIQQAQMEAVLVDIANAQGGMERIKNTPLPSQYRFFPTVFTHVFCVLLPVGLVETLGLATPLGSTVAGLMFLLVLRIGDDLVDPFANTIHDVPLSAMCRTIEIDLLQSIGDAAPDPAAAKQGVLW